MYVYILQSERSGRYYIGSTNDLTRRVAEHNFGKTKSLRGHLPVTLVFHQKYENSASARQIEHRLKRLKNRAIIQRIVDEQEIKLGPIV